MQQRLLSRATVALAALSCGLAYLPRGVVAVHEGAAVQGFTSAAMLAQHLGLRRRVDSIFSEFVDARVTGDGFGQRRGWRSVGNCPEELTITDSWGQVSYTQAAAARGGAIAEERTCSWRLRPSLLTSLEEGSEGYILDMRAPITLTFTAFSLSPYEKLEVWAPAAADIGSVQNIQTLDAYQARREEMRAQSTADTGYTVAPNTRATAALNEVAESAVSATQAAAARAGVNIPPAMLDVGDGSRDRRSARQLLTMTEEEREEATAEQVTWDNPLEYPGTVLPNGTRGSSAGGGSRNLVLLARYDGLPVHLP